MPSSRSFVARSRWPGSCSSISPRWPRHPHRPAPGLPWRGRSRCRASPATRRGSARCARPRSASPTSSAGEPRPSARPSRIARRRPRRGAERRVRAPRLPLALEPGARARRHPGRRAVRDAARDARRRAVSLRACLGYDGRRAGLHPPAWTTSPATRSGRRRRPRDRSPSATGSASPATGSVAWSRSAHPRPSTAPGCLARAARLPRADLRGEGASGDRAQPVRAAQGIARAAPDALRALDPPLALARGLAQRHREGLPSPPPPARARARGRSRTPPRRRGRTRPSRPRARACPADADVAEAVPERVPVAPEPAREAERARAARSRRGALLVIGGGEVDERPPGLLHLRSHSSSPASDSHG